MSTNKIDFKSQISNKNLREFAFICDLIFSPH